MSILWHCSEVEAEVPQSADTYDAAQYKDFPEFPNVSVSSELQQVDYSLTVMHESIVW